jgi:hypothetical protein
MGGAEDNIHCAMKTDKAGAGVSILVGPKMSRWHYSGHHLVDQFLGGDTNVRDIGIPLIVGRILPIDDIANEAIDFIVEWFRGCSESRGKFAGWVR